MAIAQVKKIYLMTFRQHHQALLETLQKVGCVQVVSSETLLSKNNLKYFLELKDGEIQDKISSYEQRLEVLEDLIEMLEKRSPHLTWLSHFVKEKELTSFADFEQLINYDEAPLVRQVKSLQDAEEKLEKEIRQKEFNIRQLQHIADWPISLENLSWPNKAFVFIFVIPTVDAASLISQLEKVVGDENHIEIVNRTHHRAIILLVGRREKKSDFLQWSENQPLEVFHLNGLRGASAENIARFQMEIETMRESLNEAAGKYATFVMELPRLRQAYDCWKCHLERLKNFYLMRQGHYTIILSGWIPYTEIPKLTQQLEKAPIDTFFVTADPEPEDSPPAAYQNPPMAEPFEFVTDLYSRPRYWEIDPTPFIGAFFALFFGICLSDAGYGIMIILVTVWAMKKFSTLSPNNVKLLKILFYGGITTTFVGFFTGGIFGITFEELPGPLENLQHIVLLNPLKDQMQFLVFTLALGILHVSFGIILKFHWKLKHHQAKDAWLDQAPWLAIILGVVILVIADWLGTSWLNPVGYILMVTAALVILVFGGRVSKNPFARFVQGLFSLYQVAGLFGDVLSYARLFALGIATGVIAGVVNFFAKLTLGIPYLGFILMPVILIAGHLMNIAINALGAFIHTTRLQFVEFFGKFYEGGGEPFEPFHMKLKYTKIKEQE